MKEQNLYKLYLGDCLDKLDEIADNAIDVIYLDPPFLTQKTHTLKDKAGNRFSFSDIWESNREYAEFIFERVKKARNKLKATGSIFFHCDKNASHIARFILDSVFGEENFRSEIIWCFKRWSNAKKGLLPTHQTVIFYSKSERFKFNKHYQDYAPTTNIEQILQKRSRNKDNKAVYAKDSEGNILTSGCKKGVPLGDVWEIPFLNPKAKERVGYPTQKPVSLLERIIAISSDEGDIILDPFCGSGTTLVAAKLNNRKAIGIDISENALSVAEKRLSAPIKSESEVMRKGEEAYINHDNRVKPFLNGLQYVPVQRNKGIDGLIQNIARDDRPVFFRVQKETESLEETAAALKKATETKGECYKIVIQTVGHDSVGMTAPDIMIIKSTALCVTDAIHALQKRSDFHLPLKQRKYSELRA